MGGRPEKVGPSPFFSQPAGKASERWLRIDKGVPSGRPATNHPIRASAMSTLAEFLASPRRLLVIAPHPDDESLGAGGLIQRAIGSGGKVHVIFVTDGDNNPWPQRYMERRWRIGPGDRARWGQRRRAEGLRALELLTGGAGSHESLGLPDAGILELRRQGAPGARPAIERAIRALQPDLLVVPSPHDRHPDHRACHLYAVEAAANTGFDGRVCAYLIHRPWAWKLLARSERSDHALTLSASEQARKLSAIECHRTQMALSRGRFSRFASPEERHSVVSPDPR